MNLHKYKPALSLKPSAFRRLKRLNSTITLSFALCISPVAIAADAPARGAITGRVLNPETGEYLKFAVVEIVGTERTVTAESGGEFTLSDVPAGDVQLRVTYAGLEPGLITVTVPAGETVRKEISLASEPTTEGEPVQLAAFVVTTEREGQAKAVQEQRVSLNSKAIVATDTYGSVSEGNVAEFLKYLPGLTLDYREGDSTFIRIRGFGPEYTAVQMDGAPVANTASANATNTSTNPGNAAGRGFEFEALTINNIESIEVTKVPMANVEASSGAGVVNMRTRRAFDRKGRQTNVTYGLVANSLFPLTLGKTGMPRNKQGHSVFPSAGIDYSDIFLSGKLGISASASVSNTIAMMQRANASWAFNTNPNDNATELVRFTAIEFKDGPAIRQRNSYGLSVDYKITPDAWVGVRWNFSDFDVWVYDRLVGFDASAGAGALYDPAFTQQQNDFQFRWSSNTAAPSNTNTTFARLRGGFFNKFSDTSTVSIPFGYKAGRFDIDGSVGQSIGRTWYRGFESGSVGMPDLVMRGIAFRVQIDDPTGDPYYRFTQLSGPGGTPLSANNSVYDPLNYPNNWNTPYVAGAVYNGVNNNASATNAGQFTIGNNTRYAKDNNWSANTNVKVKFPEWSLPTEITAGYAWRLRAYNEIRNQERYIYMPADNALTSFREDQFPLVIDNLTNFTPTFVDRYAMAQWAIPRLKDATYFQRTEALRSVDREVELKNDKDAKEEQHGLYLMGQIKVGKLDVLPGVRFERNITWGRSFKDIGDVDTRALLGLPSGTASPQSVQNTVAYKTARFGQKVEDTRIRNDFFPNFQLRYRPTANLNLLAGYRESIFRPSLGYLLPGIAGQNESATPLPTVTIGNPALVPEYGKTFNVGGDLYFGKAGTVGLYFYSQFFKNKVRNNQNSYVAGPDGVFGDPSFAGYQVIQPINNPVRVHSDGVELSYRQQLSFLPKPFDGFTVGASVNFNRPDDVQNFPFSPTRSGSLSVNYRYGRFSLNNNFTWTGTYPYFTPSLTNPVQQYRDERLQLDTTLNVRLTRNLSLTAFARNLTDSPDVYFLDKERHLVTSYIKNGTVYQLGLKATF